jgi:plastocyanin
MRRKMSVLLLGVAVAVAISQVRLLPVTAHGNQPSGAAATQVKIDNFSFGPTELTVAAGTTVQWTNRDDIPHTVVSTDGFFKSHALDTDESFSYTFEKPGTYAYFCSLHPKMTGKVIVR